MSIRLEANANPAMLLWARKEKGLDIPVAAKKASLKAEKLEKLESGDIRPSVPELRKLADVYKRPLGVFFLEITPPESPLLPDRRTLNSESVSSLSAELKMAVRQARYRREVALDLFQEIGESPLTLPLTVSLGDDAEVLATRIRDWLGADNFGPLADHRLAFNRWRETLESHGVLVFQARQVELKEMRGFALADRPLPVVVANLKDPYPARSFTLLHELAHVLLGESALCLPPSVLEETDSTLTGRVEAFCNRLAGAVLVPSDELLSAYSGGKNPSDETISQVSRRFGVSREVVVRRLLILGRVSVDFYRSKRNEYQAELEARPVRKRGRGPSPSTLAIATGGRAYARLVFEAYDEDRITTSEASDFLGVKVIHFPRIRESLRAQIDESDGDS